MPFQSKAQMRWMYATHPEMAKRWSDETPNKKKLPEKKGDGTLVKAIKRGGHAK